MLGSVLVLILALWAPSAYGAGETLSLPPVQINLGQGAAGGGGMAVTLQILFLLTVLSLAPAIMVMVTSFTRVVVVLSFLRQALGTPQVPPNQVLISLALFITFFVMAPVWNRVNVEAIQPLMTSEITQQVAFDRAVLPIREFMLKQVHEKDLALFVDMAHLPEAKAVSEVPTYVIIPAFMTSELKTAFQIGFLIYIPFLILDMVVASVLLSMGMMMLPPVIISLPFKIMLFVLIDGWTLVVGSLVRSFNT